MVCLQAFPFLFFLNPLSLTICSNPVFAGPKPIFTQGNAMLDFGLLICLQIYIGSTSLKWTLLSVFWNNYYYNYSSSCQQNQPGCCKSIDDVDDRPKLSLESKIKKQAGISFKDPTTDKFIICILPNFKFTKQKQVIITMF